MSPSFSHADYKFSTRRFEVNLSKLNADEQSQALQLATDVEAMLKSFPNIKSVKVEFKDLPKNLYGYHAPLWNEIALPFWALNHEEIIKIKKEAEEKTPPRFNHMPVELVSRSILIHEFAHALDLHSSPPISRQSWFLELAGFQYHGFFFNSRQAPDGPHMLSPDIYERTNPAEFFAVNLEFFLLDPKYKCQRPLLYEAFKKHFSTDPYPLVECDKTFIVPYYEALIDLTPSSRNPTYNQLPLIEINPEQVYAIDYLFAGKGERAMSKFGHSMLRIVICRPGQKHDENCRADLGNDLVVSFGALTGGEIDYIKGLKGDYQAGVTIFTFPSAAAEYNNVEIRDLTSYPLVLSRLEIERALKLLAQKAWSESVTYKFLSNNCADQAFNFIKAFKYDDSRLWPLKTDRPDQLLELLQRLNLVTFPQGLTKNELLKKGYFYPSFGEKFQESFKEIWKIPAFVDYFDRHPFPHKFDPLNEPNDIHPRIAEDEGFLSYLHFSLDWRLTMSKAISEQLNQRQINALRNLEYLSNQRAERSWFHRLGKDVIEALVTREQQSLKEMQQKSVEKRSALNTFVEKLKGMGEFLHLRRGSYGILQKEHILEYFQKNNSWGKEIGKVSESKPLTPEMLKKLDELDEVIKLRAREKEKIYQIDQNLRKNMRIPKLVKKEKSPESKDAQ